MQDKRCIHLQLVRLQDVPDGKGYYGLLVLPAGQELRTGQGHVAGQPLPRERPRNPYGRLLDNSATSTADTDTNEDGLVSIGSFSKLIDMAASISRMYGYAPIDTELYKTEDGKEQARRKMFNSMNLGGTGVITIDEWSKFYVEYVIAKAALVIGSPELTEDIREGGEKGERTTEHGSTVHLYSTACHNH